MMTRAAATSSTVSAGCRLRCGISFIAGNVSAAFGIGGGILKVPVLTAWCGVPMRVAAATSSLMIGVTAVASVPIQYANGYVNPPLAAPPYWACSLDRAAASGSAPARAPNG